MLHIICFLEKKKTYEIFQLVTCEEVQSIINNSNRKKALKLYNDIVKIVNKVDWEKHCYGLHTENHFQEIWVNGSTKYHFIPSEAFEFLQQNRTKISDDIVSNWTRGTNGFMSGMIKRLRKRKKFLKFASRGTGERSAW